MDKTKHISVLLQPSIEFLKVESKKTYVDLTLGGGGHSKEILSKLAGQGKLISFDLDESAIERFAKNLESEKYALSRISEKVLKLSKEGIEVILVNENFSKLQEVLESLNLPKVNGILTDLGFSSDQLDESGKGFSFKNNEELDMRMSNKSNVKAKDLLNVLGEGQLEEVFRKYGDEPQSRKIAKAIAEARKNKPLETTYELLEVINGLNLRSTQGRTLRDLLPATRIFQALRIAVNQEIDSLSSLLPQMLECVVAGSRLLVISFHSGEDRVVKHFFKQNEKKGFLKIITKKPYEPTEEEINLNRRSRSAKMRVAEKV